MRLRCDAIRPRQVSKPVGGDETRSGTSSFPRPAGTETVSQQRLAAEIRAAIADKELEIHQIRDVPGDELADFYKGKLPTSALNYLHHPHRLHHEPTAPPNSSGPQAHGRTRSTRRATVSSPPTTAGRQDGLLAANGHPPAPAARNAYLRTKPRHSKVSQSFSCPARPRALLTFAKP